MSVKIEQSAATVKNLISLISCPYILISSSEGSSEAQIKLPKPVLTYVLVQCLTNL